MARNGVARLLATGMICGFAMTGGAAAAAAQAFEPVTDAMLADPDPADWLMWRRTLDSWGYSPLDEINRETVAGLRMVWSRPLNAGSQEGTPLVHDGIMYFPHPGDVIQAIDAQSGEVIWEHRRRLPADIADYLPVHDTNRNIAIYGNLIIDTSADDYLYALDAETGEQVWETKIMDYRAGAKQSSGPIIADGLAITGRSCEPEGGIDACVITAHDAETGAEVWRTSTIARGDDPNSASWGDVPEEERIHVGSWMIASYDPALKLVYMGTSVTAPAPKIHLDGLEHQYLYHNSTLALDVETGEIVWYYQHLIDNWDLDHPFPRMVLNTEVAPDPDEVTWINPDIEPGRAYRVVTGVPGKTGIIYTLDRETGEFLWARPTVKQTVVQRIDGETGAVELNPETAFSEIGQEAEVCPSPTGGANYMAPAYSPLTGAMYFPLQNTCATMSPVEITPGQGGVYGMASRQYILPGTDNLGSIHAVNAATGSTDWTWEQRAGMQSLMTTGGNLLFAGDSHGRFRAMDQETGDVLWEVNLGSSVTGYPATFEAAGHQYVAVSTGRWLNDAYTPELIHGTQNTLYVFALPEAGIGHRGPVKEPINRRGGFRNNMDPDDEGEYGALPARSVTDGVYTEAQAAAGKPVYEEHCAACHGVDFQPAQGTPPVRGPAFLANWRGKTLGELFMLVRDTMPPAMGGSLSDEDYLASVAYMLQANGFEPGDAPLPADEALQQDIGFEE